MLSSVAAFLRARPNPGAGEWVIETCPAERYLDEPPPWSVRETLLDRESALDTLAAPTFSWRPTELVRVACGDDVAFLGAFGRDGAVDLGPESALTRQYKMPAFYKRRDVSIEWQRSSGWPGMWRGHKDARVMFSVTRALVPAPIRVLAACACARLSLKVLEQFSHPDNRPRNAIETAERWARGEITRGYVRRAAEAARLCATSAIAPEVVTLVALAAANAAEAAADSRAGERVASAVAHALAIDCVTRRPNRSWGNYDWIYSEVLQVQANEVRRVVPFRVLIEALVGMKARG